MMDAVTILADVLLLIGFAAAAVFTVDYVILRPFRRYTPWWTTGIGIMLAMLGSAITLVGLVVALSITLGSDYIGRDIIRIIGYGLFAASMVWLLVVYFVERNSRELVLFKRKDARK